jgi:hypothetical protein
MRSRKLARVSSHEAKLAGSAVPLGGNPVDSEVRGWIASAPSSFSRFAAERCTGTELG